MKRLYLIGVAVSVAYTTVENVRWAKRMKNTGEIQDEADIAVGFVSFQVLTILVSLFWPLALATILVDKFNKSTARQQY